MAGSATALVAALSAARAAKAATPHASQKMMKTQRVKATVDGGQTTAPG
jgi:hypothetical protein